MSNSLRTPLGQWEAKALDLQHPYRNHLGDDHRSDYTGHTINTTSIIFHLVLNYKGNFDERRRDEKRMA